jgi:hypothetical protein
MSDVNEMKSRRVDPILFGNQDLIDLEIKHRTGWFGLRGPLIGIWMCADANGQFLWNPRKLRMLIIKDKMRSDTFAGRLEILLKNSYIHRYNEDSQYDPEGDYCHVRTGTIKSRP